jgi:hypothetical protein
MTEAQIHAKAIIAAALLNRPDSDVGRMDLSQHWSKDPALRDLREKVDKIYDAIASDKN